MAKDMYFTETGDFILSANGDLAYTETDEQQVLQQAILRLATEKGDFPVYPQLGASLQKLVGRPNTAETANYGARLIEEELKRYSFVSKLEIDSWPSSINTIEYQINISYGTDKSVSLTLQQLLS